MPSVRKSSSGKRVVRRQKVSLVVEESQHRPCSRVTIGTLPDDVLLEIFDFYLAINPWSHNGKDEWHTLVHVCKRWRFTVFASPHRLRLQLLCKNGRPMHNILNLWPALPIAIIVNYGTSRPRIATSIIAALKQHNRVCAIHIDDIPNMLLKRIRTMKMKNPFPALTRLWLRPGSRNINALPLPEPFLGGSAPRLQTIHLNGIPFPALPKLLLSTRDLVRLRLRDIPPSGYLSPETIVTSVAALTKLQTLDLTFRCPRSRADRENRLLPRLTRIVLPVLTSFEFKGDSEYMEDIVAQIDTPLLDNLHMTFFNQLIFDTPLLRDFMCRTETFKSPREATIDISNNDVKVRLFWRDGNKYYRTILSTISCSPLDWQISSLVQIFNSALSHLLTFEHLEIIGSRDHWKDDMENAQWLEVLHALTSVKDLVLGRDIIPLAAPALEDLAGGSATTEVLPVLQNLFLWSLEPSEPVKKAIGKFTTARRFSGRPVTVHPSVKWD